MATPPTFILYGDTGGGPPVEYTWTRNGDVITNDDSHSIDIGIDNDRRIYHFTDRFIYSFYRSTLIVTGRLPGVYQYSVNNRATPTSVNTDFNIEGNSYISQKITSIRVVFSYRARGAIAPLILGDFILTLNTISF